MLQVFLSLQTECHLQLLSHFASSRHLARIDSEVANLLRLQDLYLEENLLSGSLPPGLGNCEAMIYLDLRRNNFSGMIKNSTFGRMSYLREVLLSENHFTGPLPFAHHLLELEVYDASQNHFSGDVLPEMIPNTQGVGRRRVRWPSMRELFLHSNELEGELPPLGGAIALTDLDVHGCSISSVQTLPPSLLRVDLSGNRLTQLADAFFSLPSLQRLLLNENAISSWTTRGTIKSDDVSQTGVYKCLSERVHFRTLARYRDTVNWRVLSVVDVSNNPLGVHAFTFLQSLMHDQAVVSIKAQNCSLFGDLLPLVFHADLGDGCISRSRMLDGFPALQELDLRDNDIRNIYASPTPSLVEARFDGNGLRFIKQAWFNLGATALLNRLTMTDNPDLQVAVQPPSTCSTASVLVANPAMFMVEDESHTYECTVPCVPASMTSLDTDYGTFDEGTLCRCREGYGLLPQHGCWDAYWSHPLSVAGPSMTCSGSDCSDEQVGQVCCKCGGTGGGGNGRNCSLCPSDTYSFSEPEDTHRWRSVCHECPLGSTTNGTEGASSVCQCSCPEGTYLAGGEMCEESSGVVFGNETCSECPVLRTTRGSGHFSQAACVCDLSINELVEDGGYCGCSSGHFLNTKSIQCDDCSIEGEWCDWYLNIEGSLLVPYLLPGYWATTRDLVGTSQPDFTGHSIYRCFSVNTCTNFRGGCATGRKGQACALCEDGFYGGPDGECKKCEDASYSGVFIALLLIPIVVLVVHEIMAEGQSSQARGVFLALRAFRVSMKQLVKHLQIMSIVSGFRISWPVDVQGVFDVVKLFTFQVADLVGIACYSPTGGHSASMEIGARWLLPVLFTAVGLFVTPLLGRVVNLVLRPARRTSRSSMSRISKFMGKRAQMSLWDAKKAVYWCMLLFFATLLNYGLAMLTCQQNPNGVFTVKYFPHLHCFGGGRDADLEWIILMCGAIVYIIICLGYFLGIYWWAWRETAKHMRTPGTQGRGYFGFLFEDFRDIALSFPFSLFGRDILFNFSQALLINSGGAQLMVTGLFSLIFGLRVLHQQPYSDVSNNFLELVNAILVFSVCVFTAGMGFASEPSLQDMATLVKGTSGEATMELRGKFLLGMQLVSVLGPISIIWYQVLCLFPCFARRMPTSIRPLPDAAEKKLRKALCTDLGVDDGPGNTQLHKNVRKIMEEMDATHLFELGTLLASPCHTVTLPTQDSYDRALRRRLHTKEFEAIDKEEEEEEEMERAASGSSDGERENAMDRKSEDERVKEQGGANAEDGPGNADVQKENYEWTLQAGDRLPSEQQKTIFTAGAEMSTV